MTAIPKRRLSHRRMVLHQLIKTHESDDLITLPHAMRRESKEGFVDRTLKHLQTSLGSSNSFAYNSNKRIMRRKGIFNVAMYSLYILLVSEGEMKEILADKELLEGLKRAEQDYKEGRYRIVK